MAIKTIDTLKTDINTALADNTTGDISPVDVRSSVVDTVDSLVAIAPVIYEADEVPVLFTIGQSNTDGRGNTTDTPSIDVDFTGGKVKIWNKAITRNPSSSTVNRTDDGAWKEYALGDMVTTPEGTAATAFGPELQIAKRWRDNNPTNDKTLHIIKCCVGGTSLADDTGDVDDSWADTDDSLRELFVNYFALPAIKQLQLDGLKPRCVGVIWGQGESDAQTAAMSPNYQTNLTSFIPDVLGKIGFSNAKFLIMGLSAYSDGDTDWDTVKTAQSTVAALSDNYTLVPTDGTDNQVEIQRYLSGVGAGNIHYSSEGILTLGNKYFDLLDYEGEAYSEINDYALYGSSSPDGAVIDKSLITTDDETHGRLGFVSYPLDSGYANAITWIRSGEIIARPGNGTKPAPSFFIDAMDNHSDAEIIFRMIHDGDSNTKPGFVLRSSDLAVDGDPTTGYLVQVRQGGGQLTIFRRDGSSWTSLTGSPATPSQSPAVSAPYWYRITMIGDDLTVYNSPDGRTWTQQYTVTDSTYASGKLWFSLYNGKCDKTIGNLYVSHCAFDVITAKKL